MMGAYINNVVPFQSWDSSMFDINQHVICSLPFKSSSWFPDQERSIASLLLSNSIMINDRISTSTYKKQNCEKTYVL